MTYEAMDMQVNEVAWAINFLSAATFIFYSYKRSYFNWKDC